MSVQKLADINTGKKFTLPKGSSSEVFLKTDGPYLVSMSDPRSLSAVNICTGKICHWEEDVQVFPTD